MAEVAAADRLHVDEVSENFERVLADRLEVAEPAINCPLQEALFDQSCQPVEVDLGDVRRRLQIEAADEDSDSRGEVSFRLRQQIEAPRERRAKRLLPCR
ncbi:MAG: hypothetical protein ACREU4_09345, partial [Burkholderiales bacterium]